MAVSINDIIRYKEYGVLGGQEILNVYFYRITNKTGAYDLPELNDALYSLLWFTGNGRKSWTTNNYTLAKTEVENLTDGISFDQQSRNDIGAVTSVQALPPQDTVTVRFLRATKVTRNGYKRFSGLTEDNQSNGVLDTAFRISVGLTADLMVAPYTDDQGGGNTCEFTPIIVGRDATGQPDLTRTNSITSYLISYNVTSQNSRKRGTGN